MLTKLADMLTKDARKYQRRIVQRLTWPRRTIFDVSHAHAFVYNESVK